MKISFIFRQGKETQPIKDRILRDIKNLFEYEEENYYKSVRVNNLEGMSRNSLLEVVAKCEV